ncbi:hypothetical protein, partial [Sinomonas soli]
RQPQMLHHQGPRTSIQGTASSSTRSRSTRSRNARGSTAVGPHARLPGPATGHDPQPALPLHHS